MPNLDTHHTVSDDTGLVIKVIVTLSIPQARIIKILQSKTSCKFLLFYNGYDGYFAAGSNLFTTCTCLINYIDDQLAIASQHLI